MVDYSKWSKLDVSESEHSSDSEGDLPATVKRFDASQKVTFGGGKDVEIRPSDGRGPGRSESWEQNTKKICSGVGKSGAGQLQAAPGSVSSSSVGAKAGRTNGLCPGKDGLVPSQKGMQSASDPLTGSVPMEIDDCGRGDPVLPVRGAEEALSAGDKLVAEDAVRKTGVPNGWTRNGGFVDSVEQFPLYYWSQRPHEVTVRFQCPSTRFGAGDVKFSCLTITKLQISGLFTEDQLWMYEIDLPKDTEDDLEDRCHLSSGQRNIRKIQIAPEDVDWEFETIEMENGERTKFLKLTVKKRQFVQKSVFWWRAVFKGHPEMSPESMVDRNQKNVEKQRKFYDVMQEATEIFKKKVQNHEKQDILCEEC